MNQVYLCGGINGLSDAECNDWRAEAKHALWAECVDPMTRDYRGVEEQAVVPIVTGDLADIRGCDALLVNATRPSWGTAMELVYAHQYRKFVVAFVGEGARVSPWLRYHCVHVVPSLSEAVKILNWRLKEKIAAAECEVARVRGLQELVAAKSA